MSTPTTLDGARSRARRRNYGKNHAYYLETARGEVKLDGVTTLIGNGIRKPAIENWSGNVTAEYAVNNWDALGQMPVADRLKKLQKARFESRDEAAARGTAVHNLAERIVAGEEVEVPDELVGRVNAAVAFLNDWQVESILNEATVWSEAGLYGGTLDGVMRSRVWDAHPLGGRGVEQRTILFDWKTNRTGIYGETALQLSGYENAEYFIGDDGLDHPMSELGITDAWAVWIRDDGYSVFPMERGPEVFKTFQVVAMNARRTQPRSRDDDNPLDLLKGAELQLVFA